MYFSIENKSLVEKIKTLIKNADFQSLYFMTKTPTIYQWMVINFLINNIPELEIITSTKSDLLSSNKLAKTVTIKKQQKY